MPRVCTSREVNGAAHPSFCGRSFQRCLEPLLEDTLCSSDARGSGTNRPRDASRRSPCKCRPSLEGLLAEDFSALGLRTVDTGRRAVACRWDSLARDFRCQARYRRELFVRKRPSDALDFIEQNLACSVRCIQMNQAAVLNFVQLPPDSSVVRQILG